MQEATGSEQGKNVAEDDHWLGYRTDQEPTGKFGMLSGYVMPSKQASSKGFQKNVFNALNQEKLMRNQGRSHGAELHSEKNTGQYRGNSKPVAHV